MLACCARAVRHMRQAGSRVRPWGDVGAYCAPQGVKSPRGGLDTPHCLRDQLYAVSAHQLLWLML